MSNAQDRPQSQEQGSETEDSEKKVITLTDPKAIRALAHGVRLTVIEELLHTQEAYTATELATEFGLTPSAMSYHLRALEKWGLVQRVEVGSDGRERHWQAAGTHLSIKTGTSGDSGQAAAMTMLSAQVDAMRNKLQKAFTNPEGTKLKGSPEENEYLPVWSFGTLAMTKQERTELARLMWDTVQGFHSTLKRTDRQALESSGEDLEEYSYYVSFIPDEITRKRLAD